MMVESSIIGLLGDPKSSASSYTLIVMEQGSIGKQRPVGNLRSLPKLVSHKVDSHPNWSWLVRRAENKSLR